MKPWMIWPLLLLLWPPLFHTLTLASLASLLLLYHPAVSSEPCFCCSLCLKCPSLALHVPPPYPLFIEDFNALFVNLWPPPPTRCLLSTLSSFSSLCLSCRCFPKLCSFYLSSLVSLRRVCVFVHSGPSPQHSAWHGIGAQWLFDERINK